MSYSSKTILQTPRAKLRRGYLYAERIALGGRPEAAGSSDRLGGLGCDFYADLNWYLLMRRFLIFDSRVVRGMPSLRAAPDGPEIRPWLSSRAASIISAFLTH